jgi:RNA polymerase sigma-70 factor (ECF subfamily)
VTEDFPAFFERSMPAVLARALVLTGDRAEAETAVRDAFAEALRRWEVVRTRPDPQAWVYDLVKQRIWATSRRWTVRQRPLNLPIVRPPGGGPERTAEARLVLTALSALPRKQRTIAVLHLLHGRGAEEIAAELGVRRAVVASAIDRARRTLEKVLGTHRSAHADEPFAPASRRGSLPPGAPPDPLADAVRRTERFLREGVETDQEAVRRMLAEVEDAAGESTVTDP